LVSGEVLERILFLERFWRGSGSWSLERSLERSLRGFGFWRGLGEDSVSGEVLERIWFLVSGEVFGEVFGESLVTCSPERS